MPHVTIVKLANEKDATDAIGLLPEEQCELSVGNIGIAPFAPFGACTEILNWVRFTSN